MSSIRLTRSCFNYFNLGLIDSSCLFHRTIRRLSLRKVPVVPGNSEHDAEKSAKTSSDTFGTLSGSTKKPSTNKWTSNVSRPTREYKNKPKVVKLKKDEESDKFGLLNPTTRTEPDDLEGDEGDAFDERMQNIRRPVRWKTVASYGRDMKRLILNRKLGEALALLKKMKEVDMVKPDDYVYNVLIGGCGKYGFTSMAFQLYKEMRERGMKGIGPTWTGLFNSCGNSPFPDYGLKKARYLYESLTEKGIAMNAINYHSAIKAFGRCGDLQTAFRLVDEMVEKKVTVTTETFNFLLMGCASDIKSGFLQAILVWRKMHEKRIKPDTFSYNLLLRVTRDCRLGDMQLAEQLLLSNPSQGRLMEVQTSKNLPGVSHPHLAKSLSVTSQVQSHLPDVLSPNCQPGSVTKLIEPKTPQDRLSLLGGMFGILGRMSMDKAKPELKTFTELLELIPSDIVCEVDLLKVMSTFKVNADVDFYNVLIKKRNHRDDFKGAKDVLTLIAQNNLHPDIATFGTIAIGCNTRSHGHQLLRDIKEAGFRPNIEILGALIQQACHSRDFWYVIDVLKIIRAEDIKPSLKLIQTLEKRIKTTKEYLLKKEKEGIRFAPDDPLIKSFKEFLMMYKPWLKSTKMQLPDDPWDEYRIPQNVEDLIEADSTK